MFFKVVGKPAQKIGVVCDFTKSGVAAIAQKLSHPTGNMAVVD